VVTPSAYYKILLYNLEVKFPHFEDQLVKLGTVWNVSFMKILVEEVQKVMELRTFNNIDRL